MGTSLELMHEMQSVLFDLKSGFRRSIEENDIPISPMAGRVLKLIDSQDGMTQQEIGKRFKRDKAQIARVVKELLEQNLIQKKVAENDKRAQLLYLQPEGRKLAEQVHVLKAQVAEEFLSILSEHDKNQLASLLTKLSTGRE